MAASQDEALAEQALGMALVRRRPQAGLLHDSVRGYQYNSNDGQAPLAEVGITVSLSRKGNCYDHAAMESFFGTVKGQCVELHCFQTRILARPTIFE